MGTCSAQHLAFIREQKIISGKSAPCMAPAGCSCEPVGKNSKIVSLCGHLVCVSYLGDQGSTEKQKEALPTGTPGGHVFMVCCRCVSVGVVKKERDTHKKQVDS